MEASCYNGRYKCTKQSDEFANHVRKFVGINNKSYVDILDKIQDEYGSMGIITFLKSTTPLVTFPNIFMPNGTLTQTFTTSGGTTLVTNSHRAIGSPNYNMSITVGNGTSNSPQLFFCVFQQVSSGNLAGVANLFPFRGYYAAMVAGSGSGAIVNSMSAVDGTTGLTITNTPSATNVGVLSLKEQNNMLTVAYGNPVVREFTYDVSNIFTSSDRFIHIYRNDAGVSGTSQILTIRANVI